MKQRWNKIQDEKHELAIILESVLEIRLKENEEDLSDEDFQILSVDKPSSSNSQGMKSDKGETPMKFDDVEAGMWVIVVYEGEKFLGNVQDKKASQFNVLCLEKPFGINVPQNFEKGEGVYYDNVFQTDIKPEQTQVDEDGKKAREWFWK